MAPVQFQTHSCAHCQKVVFDLTHESPYIRGTSSCLFNFTVADLLSADLSGCIFSKWILDDRVRRWPTSGWSFEGTLRDAVSARDPVKDAYQLFASTFPVSAEVSDLLQINRFGLYDVPNKELVYETLMDFQVFACPQDPASKTVSTRPIEAEPASDHGFETYSTWLRNCKSDHPHCSDMPGNMPERRSNRLPKRLIQINALQNGFHLALRNTDALDTVQFAALSYCWGGDQPVKCLTSTISEFLIEIPLLDLPQTIVDTVRVSHELGIEYLWIDALCIVQDDPTDKAVEIAKMPYIYGNAEVAIAASRSRSVYDGFLGKREVAHKEAVLLPYLCSDGTLGSIHLVNVHSSPEPIDSRGWTLQERLLSRRTLEFGTLQTRFSCQESSHWESGSHSDGWISFTPYNNLRVDHLQLPDLPGVESWYNIVGRFTRRVLTVPSDRSLAISGIAEAYATLENDHYVAGLWKSNLPFGLLWSVPRDEPIYRPTTYLGPSWSWTSVNGPISFWVAERPNTKPDSTFIYAEVLDIRLNLETNLAPYGALCAGSLIRLKLRTTIVSSIALDELDDNKRGRTDFTRPAKKAVARITIDAIDLIPGPKKEDFTLAEIANFLWSSNWVCRGLVLRTIDAQRSLYSRVGAFTLSEKALSGGREWQENIKTEFDWFKDCESTVIDII